MHLSRRDFLKISGAATVAILSGTAWRAVDQGVFSAGQGPAYQPWQDWQTASAGTPLALVRAAILAANPHNTQPWRFRLGADRIDLYADPARNIGAIDPFRREMYVGLGCALENLLLAAGPNGYAAELRLMPEAQDAAHVAEVALTASPAVWPDLYAALSRRHTHRGPYLDRPVASDILEQLAARGKDLPEVQTLWVTGAPERQALGQTIVQATEAIMADQQQSQDSAQWFRQDWGEVQRQADGITLDAQANPLVVTVLGKMLPPLSAAENDRYWLQATRTQVATAAAFGFLVVPEARRHLAQLAAGRLYQRLHLAATRLGLAMQPLNQILERIDREASLGAEPVFGRAAEAWVGQGRQGVMLFRLGYAAAAALPSPRRGVQAVILS